MCNCQHDNHPNIKCGGEGCFCHESIKAKLEVGDLIEVHGERFVLVEYTRRYKTSSVASLTPLSDYLAKFRITKETI